MRKNINLLRPKSFLITVASIDLISGTLSSLYPDLFSLKGQIPLEGVRIASIFFFLGALMTIYSLGLRKNQSKATGLALSLTVVPYLYSTYLALGRGSYQTATIFLVMTAGIILAVLSNNKDVNGESKSLLNLMSGILSLCIGITFFLPPLTSNLIYDPIRNNLMIFSIIFLLAGLLAIKLSKETSAIQSSLSIILSTPLAFLGIFFILNNAARVGIVITSFFIMLIVRLVIKSLIGNPEEEEMSIEKEILNSYNKVLETAAIGSLVLISLSTFTSLCTEEAHTIVTTLVFLFALATIIWFHIIPHKFLSKKQLQTWINLYALFIVIIITIQSTTAFNPFLILFAIPIYFSYQLFPEHSTIYPTWIALISITFSFFQGIASEQTIPISELTSIASVRYAFVLVINYIASKTL